MPEVEPNKFYLTIDCEKCSRGLAFQEAPEDPSEGVMLPNELSLTCHACGHTGKYRPEQVRRSQGQYKN